MNVNLNHGRVDPQELQRRQAEGRLLLNFAAEVYRDQLARGAHFLHEHPLAATSWDEPDIRALRAQSRVQEVTAHQCCFGLEARDPSGSMELVMKPTRFMSSAPLLLKKACAPLQRRAPPHAAAWRPPGRGRSDLPPGPLPRYPARYRPAVPA